MKTTACNLLENNFEWRVKQKLFDFLCYMGADSITYKLPVIYAHMCNQNNIYILHVHIALCNLKTLLGLSLANM